MKKLHILIVLMAVTGCSDFFSKPAATVKFDQLSFMVGEWRDNHYGSGLTEIWKRVDDQKLHGQGIVVQNGDTVFSENTYIEVIGDDIFYKVVIGKRKPVLFKMTYLSDNEVVFENPEHDNPKKITYKIQSDGSLHAVTEGEEKGKTVSDKFMMNRVK